MNLRDICCDFRAQMAQDRDQWRALEYSMLDIRVLLFHCYPT